MKEILKAGHSFECLASDVQHRRNKCRGLPGEPKIIKKAESRWGREPKKKGKWERNVTSGLPWVKGDGPNEFGSFRLTSFFLLFLVDF